MTWMKTLWMSWLWMLSLSLFGTVPGCHVLHPKAIVPSHNNLPSNLNREEDAQFEYGTKRPIIDGFGWVWGIPSKILFWNRRVENHHITPETEAALAEYLAVNGLDEIKVRCNQYRPLDDWRRLTRNTSVAWPWRYTFGAVSVLGETLVPGRLFGGDHFNPYTGTIHLYSDVPVIGLHEGGHAKDFSRRDYPGWYAAAYTLPGVPLWHEKIATEDVLAYVDQGDPEIKRQAYHVLLPAYGTYMGGAVGSIFPDYATSIYYGAVLAGHAKGRMRARNFPVMP